MTGWYHDAALVASLPRRFRWYAAYCRMVARPSGRVPGGSFLFRRLRDLARLLRLRRRALARVGPYQVAVDLLDQRMLTAFAELRHAGPEDQVLDRALPAGATFVDVGANHGTWAIRAAARVGPTGRVIAIEPNPVLAECVRESLAAAGVPHVVHAVAVGAEHGDALLHVPIDSSGLASLMPGYASGPMRQVRVPMATLDDLLADVPAGTSCLLKLDIEGAEHAALAGGATALRRLRPLIVWELNPRSAAAAGHGVTSLFAAFAAAGYTRFAELGQGPALLAAEALDTARQRNLLAIPDGGA